MKKFWMVAAWSFAFVAASQARAQEADDGNEPRSVAVEDGPRFRFGIDGGIGGLFGGGASFTYVGTDLRLGVQINDLVAVYAQPQLGGYFGDVLGFVGTGGLVGVSALAELTFIDRLFVAAGGGFAVLNNPSGGELHFRAGGYPLMSRSSAKARRKGMSVGADLRLHFVNGQTFTAPTFTIGYDAF